MHVRLLFAALFALAAVACSGDRSRAIAEPAAGQGSKPSGKNYREVFERSRNKAKTADTVQAIQDAIQRFQRDVGRVPSNLVELVVRRYIPGVPQLPGNNRLAYDASMGTLSVVAVKQDVLTPELPPAPELTNRPTLSPLPRP
jgi:hypothetical protein